MFVTIKASVANETEPTVSNKTQNSGDQNRLIYLIQQEKQGLSEEHTQQDNTCD